jgi:hypothetical protein
LGHQQRLNPATPASLGAPESTRQTATYWQVGDSLTACFATDRILFLDVKRDRYLALPPGDTQMLLACLQQADGGDLPEPCREMLARLGLVDARARTGLRVAARTVTRPEAIDSEWPPRTALTPSILFNVARAVIPAAREIRTRPLELVLRRRMDADAASPPLRNRGQRVAEFHSARPFIPVPRVCLHDSLALFEWLGGVRGGTELVFGVSAQPFAAHCWVQADGLVLDDHPDNPSRFQPILHFP